MCIKNLCSISKSTLDLKKPEGIRRMNTLGEGHGIAFANLKISMHLSRLVVITIISN